MNFVNKIRLFFSFDVRKKFLFLEAFLYLGWARFLIKMPFVKVAPSLGVQMQETSIISDNVHTAVLKDIHEAIQIMSNHTFWESKCLVKAITGMKMLKKRNLECTLYLGTAKDENGKLIAHAWLRSGSYYITGAEGKEKFTILGKFANRNDIDLDVTFFSEELKFMFFLLNKRSDKALTELDKQKFKEINWKLFMNLIGHHRVYPSIYKKLKQLTTDYEWIPKYIYENLHRDYQINTFKMLQLSGEMEIICKLLNKSRIRTIFLKGPVLAADLYGDVSLRTSCDLDILISINDLNKTEELLLLQGYEKNDYIQTVLGDWKWRHHHITFIHPIKNIKLEIHWRLSPGPSMEPRFLDLWNRRRRSTLTNYPVYLLGKEDLFLFLITHGARHGWSRIRWLEDIDKILRQSMDWGQIKNQLHKYQYSKMGGQALILAKLLFHTPMNEQMYAIMYGKKPRKLALGALFYIKQMINLHTIPVPKEVSKYHQNHLFSLMSFQQRFLFILSLFFPYPEDVQTLPLPKKIHFLYFFLRPFLWIFRKTKISYHRGGPE